MSDTAVLEFLTKLNNQTHGGFSEIGRDLDGIDEKTGRVSGSMQRMGSVVSAGMKVAGVAIAGAGVAFAAFTGKGIKDAIDMEQQMANIAAVMGTTKEAIAPLADTIVELGLDPNLKVDAQQAAAAIEMLGKNGLDMTQIMEGAAHSTVLMANATGGEFAQSADIATDIMAMFKIEAEEMSGVVDGVTSVVNNSKFDITDYQYALANAGGTAASVGVSFDDMNTSIVGISAGFAGGADAGTSFKSFLTRLVPSGGPAKEMMQDLGLITEEAGNRFYDAEGNMKGMAEISGVLQEALGGLSDAQQTQALKTIFGSYSMRTAIQLSELGEEGFRNLQETMGQTSAVDAAAERMNTLSGAIEIFQGIIESARLKLGTYFVPGLREVVGIATEVATSLMTMFDNIQGGMAPLDAISDLLGELGFGGEQLSSFQLFVAGLIEAKDAAIAFVQDSLIPFIQQIGEMVTPIVQAVTSFISFKDVLMVIGAVALWVIGAALAPIIATVALIAAAFLAASAIVAAVRTAWETNFLGIRDAVTSVTDTISTLGNYFKFAAEDGDYLNDFLADLPGWMQPIVEKIGMVVGSFDTLRDYFSFTAEEGDYLNDSLVDLPAPLQDIAMEIGKVVGVFGEFKQRLSEGNAPIDAFRMALGNLGEGAQQAFDMLVGFFGPTIERIKESLGGLRETLSNSGANIDGLKEAFARLQPILMTIAGIIGGVLAIAVKLIGELFANLLANAGTIFAGLVDVVTGNLNVITSILGGVINIVMALIAGDWAGAWAALQEAVQGAIDGVEQVLDGLLGIIDGIVGAIWDSIANLINDLGGTAKDWEEVKQVVVDAWEEIKEGVQSAVDSVVEIWNNFVETAQGIVDNITEAWESLKEFDISEVIDNFVSAIADAPGLITDALAGWYQAFVDWVAGIDWYQVGYDIVTFILDGYAYFTEELPNAISTWAGDMISAIGDKASEWLEAGIEIVTQIVEGFTEFPGKVEEEVTTWPQTIAGFIGDAANLLSIVGEAIITHVIEGIKAFADLVEDVITEWPGEISAYITENIDAFIEVGRNIGRGVRDGILNMLNGVKEAIKDLVTGAEDAANEKGEMESPSRLFWRIGEMLAAGLALGITDNIPAVAAAAAQMLEGVNTEALLKLAEIVTAITDAIAPAIGSMRQLASMSVDSAVLDKIELFEEYVSAVIQAMATIAQDMEGFRDKTLEIVKVMAETSEMIGAAVISLRLLARLDLPTTLDAKLMALGEMLGRMVMSLAEMALEMDGMRNQVLKFAQIVSEVVDFLPDAIIALSLLGAADFERIVGGWHLRDQIVILSKIIATLMREFLTAALELTGLAEQVEAFAKAAQEVVDLIVPTIDAMIALSETDFGAIVQGWHLRDQIVILRNIIRTLMREFTDAAFEIGEHLATEVEAFAAAATEVVDLIAPAIDAVIILAETDFGPLVQGWRLADQIVIFRNIIRTLMREFALAAGEIGSELAAEVEAFAESTQSVFELIGEAMDGIALISEYVPVEDIYNKVHAFGLDLFEVAGELILSLDQVDLAFGGAVEGAQSVSATVENVLGVVAEAVEAIGFISEYVAVDDIYNKVHAFGLDLFEVAGELLLALDQVDLAFGGAIEGANRVSATVETVLGIVTPAIEAIAAIADYASVEGLEAKVQDFADQLETAAMVLIDEFDTLSGYFGEKVATAQAFALAVGEILDSSKSVADGLAAIAGLEMTDTTAQMDFILAQAKIIAEKLEGATGALDTDTIQAARDFATAVAEMVQAVEDALGNLNELVNADSAGSLQTILDDMVANMQNSAPDSGAAATEIGDAFETGLMTILNAIPDAVKEIMADIIAEMRDIIPDAKTAGEDLAKALSTGLSVQKPSVHQTGFTIGAAAGQGILDGINSKLQAIKNAAAQAASAAAQAAAAELEISSPSQVFYRLGVQSIQGFVAPFANNAAIAPAIRSGLGSAVGRSVTNYSNVASQGPTYEIHVHIPAGSNVSRSMVRGAVKEGMLQSGRAANAQVRMK